MLKKKTHIAIVTALISLSFPQVSVAQDDTIFKSSEVLNWNPETQRFYLETSIRMVGIVASRNSPEQSQCFENWYKESPQIRHQAILGTMREYSDYHPQGIILAYMEKQCGSMVYTK